MKEYVKNLGTVLMMIAVANIIIPEGNIKKFASLAMGFLMISTAIVPLNSIVKGVENAVETLNSDERSIESAQKEYKKQVLDRHRENLVKKINEHIRHGSEVVVEVDGDGNLTEVIITLKGDESRAVAYITRELKLPRERITLKYENN